MTVTEVLDLISEALEIESDGLSPDTLIADVPEWTSIGWLTIMALVDERMGVQVTPGKIRGFRRVRDLIDDLATKTSISE